MALTGELQDFQLQEVLQILAMGRKTGILTLSGDHAHGTIVLSAGQLSEVRTARLEGEAAFHELAGNRSGTFSFESLPMDELPKPAQPFPRPLEALLIELSMRSHSQPDADAGAP